MKKLETQNFPNLPGHIGDLFVTAINKAIEDGYVFTDEQIEDVYVGCSSSVSMRRQELIDSVSNPTNHLQLLAIIFKPNFDKLFQK